MGVSGFNRRCLSRPFPRSATVGFWDSVVAMYSCNRKLRPNYLGPLCRLYSVNLGQSRDFYPTPAGFLNTSELWSFADGGDLKVEAVYDQTEMFNAFENLTTATMPLFFTGGATFTMGRLPIMRFGSGRFLKAAGGDFPLHDATLRTLHLVYRVNNTAAVKTLLASKTATATDIGMAIKISATEQPIIEVRNGVADVVNVSKTGGASPSFEQLVVQLDNSNASASGRESSRRNELPLAGSNAASAAPSGAASTYDLYMGMCPDTTLQFDGDIGELCIYSGWNLTGDIEATTRYDYHTALGY